MTTNQKLKELIEKCTYDNDYARNSNNYKIITEEINKVTLNAR